jgi:NADPH-dependent glutamate synthase beta subunit-like oxidoreductase/NAD-dependent dihydropyrimidine dehydrogenase PreA subunit
VPIKKLKHLVSGIDENFRDFSVPKARVKNASKKNKKVGIVGAGPAGLSAAYDLVQSGYDVTIFEKENKAGGMVTFAIPDFRMDKTGFDYEAMQLAEMGVKFFFNTSLGKELPLERLSKEYDAVILAIGMNQSKKLNLIDSSVPVAKRTDALSFLKSFNLKEQRIEPGSTILIIGGGNSAIDAARSAKKLSNLNKVIVSCIETDNTMPAFAEEVKHAVEEEIDFVHDSYVESCTIWKSGEINVVLHSFRNKKLLQNLKCDYIITAIGQTTDPAINKNLSKDENLRVKSEHSFTGYKNVFVAGDISSGNNMSVIGAIASGKKSAVAVRKLLENYKYNYEGEKALERLNTNPTPTLRLRRSIVDEDIKVELEKYNLGCPAMVKVNGKVQIDQSRCNLCGLCIDVCPNNAIQWSVGADKVLESEEV